MVALYIILGIVLLFVVLFSMHVTLIVDYAEKTVVTVKYLFVKFTVFDSSKPESEKKPKKPKKEKKKDAENSESTSDSTAAQPEAAAEKPKTKGNSLFKQIYLDHGYDGIVKCSAR